jgi:hypothetical protein
MNKLKKYFSLAIVFWGVADLSQISLAQQVPYWVIIQPPDPRHHRPNNNSRSSSSSGRTYPGEYRFECERRLGYWEWEKRSEQYPFNSREDEYCNAMKENIKRSCRHLPNP